MRDSLVSRNKAETGNVSLILGMPLNNITPEEARGVGNLNYLIIFQEAVSYFGVRG